MLDYINNEFGKAWVSSQYHARRGVFLPLVYIDINEGNLHDAVVFAQIMYWHEPNRETGKTRLRVLKDGYWWLVKNHGDWESEVRISRRTVRNCLERIKGRGLIVYELHGHAGKKAPYIRVNWDVFKLRIEELENSGEMVGSGLDTPALKCQGSGKSGQSPDISGLTPCPEMSAPLPLDVKSNTEITKTTAETTTETRLEGEAGWCMQGAVPIKRLLLLPASVQAQKAIDFFETNIAKANAFVRGEILAACQAWGETAVLGILADAAKHNAKGWAYVETILKRVAQDQAAEMAREIAHQAAVVGLATVERDKADEAGLVPTNKELPVAAGVQAVCPGHGGTAAETWGMVHFQLELQLDTNTFETYGRRLRLVDYQAGSHRFVVAAASAHGRDMCEHRLGRHIKKLFSEVCEQPMRVDFICAEMERGAA